MSHPQHWTKSYVAVEVVNGSDGLLTVAAIVRRGRRKQLLAEKDEFDTSVAAASYAIRSAFRRPSGVIRYFEVCVSDPKLLNGLRMNAQNLAPMTNLRWRLIADLSAYPMSRLARDHAIRLAALPGIIEGSWVDVIVSANPPKRSLRSEQQTRTGKLQSAP